VSIARHLAAEIHIVAPTGIERLATVQLAAIRAALTPDRR